MAEDPIILKAPNGTEARILGSKVARIRASFPEENEPSANTRIDWVGLAFAQEDAKTVADLVKIKLASLAQLALPNGKPVWFNAKIVDGPIRTTRFERHDGVKSAMMLMGKKLYLSSTPEQVSAAINANGGTALPIPDEGLMGDIIGAIRGALTPTAQWD